MTATTTPEISMTQKLGPDTATALLTEAVAEARSGVAEGGMPFGALLVLDGRIVSRGHNRQIQDNQYLAHAETICLSRHMRNSPDPLPADSILVATEAPCPMCAGTAIVAGIRTFIIGEAVHYQGAAAWLSRNADVHVLNNQRCIDLVTDFRRRYPERWQRFSAG